MQKGFAHLSFILKILIGIGVLILIFGGASLFSIFSNQNVPPPQITANFVNLDKVEKISRFRSCTGHVVVPQNEKESKRNMKHYLWEKEENRGADKVVEIYAPFDGYITLIFSLNDNEQELWISPRRMFANIPPVGMWSFSVEHIKVKDGLKTGDRVKAGELVGFTGFLDGYYSFDAIYGKIGLPPKKIDNWLSPFADLDSVFNHMSDEVFAQFQQKGVVSKKQVIISKEERDQNPCDYRGERPELMEVNSDNSWVELH